jgi:hypothetical protein
MDHIVPTKSHREPWNKGKLVGQKAPLKLKDIWAIRVRLQISDRARDQPSTASCARAISSSSGYVTYPIAGVSRRALLSCSRRPIDPSNLKSWR